MDRMNPNEYRKDVCGALIVWSDYGKETNFGWEIDHILPIAKGETDHDDNLRVIHWENNRSKADNFPNYEAAVTFERNKNIPKKGNYTVHELTLKQLKNRYPDNKHLKGDK